jgi:hypothetical protein
VSNLDQEAKFLLSLIVPLEELALSHQEHFQTIKSNFEHLLDQRKKILESTIIIMAEIEVY